MSNNCPAQKWRGPPSGGPAVAGKWEVFDETNLEGSISGTVQQGRVFKTISGNLYEVTGLTLQLVLELPPNVTVLRNGDAYKLLVEGFDEPIIYAKLNGGVGAKISGNSTGSVIESRVDGEFKGWEGDTIIKRVNGQIWQQSRPYYHYHYAYTPKVIVYSSGGIIKMKVDGVDEAVSIALLNK